MNGMGYLYRVESDKEVREFPDEIAAKQYQSSLPPGSSRSVLPRAAASELDQSISEAIATQ